MMLIHYFHIRDLKSDGSWSSLCFSLMPGVYGSMEPECACGHLLVISPLSPCVNLQLSAVLCAVVSATPTFSPDEELFYTEHCWKMVSEETCACKILQYV